ncbi:hypothetical protein O3M35_000087 [Rhynocoris fuscipes]|uniref:Unconventional myosin-Va n=1 Tax=Rhynocoris fuscipes TaxID=488301 RepID=A0AAW1DM99_9HEMI
MGDLDPHIFAVAEEAYTKMEREQNDQSIIVSGESGAGKTVSAKYAMRYFATVGGSTTETQVERKVLASSPIMEAIGNAKTTRNDNSSRFGKYIELHFSHKFTIVGASMNTYLLEKSRVIFQSPGERNYHIFYQLCASREKLPKLHLDSAECYNYLCDSEHTIDGVNDGEAYNETLEALYTLGFSKQEIDDICLCLASVLHLGNISITDSAADGDICYISNRDKHLLIFTKLLDINIEELTRWLTHRKIVSTRESLNIPMKKEEAAGARDALAKHIYACLFSSIVTTINRALKTSSVVKQRFIGVLDIYGFETFDVNSFEQFCINYANEKLQQQFNLHVFKLEQTEYIKEGIEWKFIDFYDNQSCIDLIESKLGVLDLLDEECKMPRGSDTSWAEKLYSKCTKSAHFVKPRFGSSSFLIKHFADKVNYDVTGFLEKNKDTVLEEQVAVLRGSTNKLMRSLFTDSESKDKLVVPKTKIKLVPASTSAPSSSAKNKKTVGSQFRDSLNALMATLNATTPHYIRCIKPNDDKHPFKYHSGRVVQQLRACGVLETIRISAAGYPSRWLYADFLKRYRVLCKSKDVNWTNKRETCEKILSYVIKDTDKYQFGNTKIFFRAGQVAYLERLRSDRLLECCVKIQAFVRGFIHRCRYKKMLTAIYGIQKYGRGLLARRLADHLRKNRAAIVIQTRIRGWIKRKQYLRTKKTVLGLQKYGRGLLARRRYQEMRETRAAIIIQAAIRRWLARKRYQRIRSHVIICQSAVRRFLARRRYKKMKREAKSAEHLKKLNKGLENKIISLQQKISEMGKEMSYLKQVIQEGEELKQKLNAMRGIEVQLKTATEENSAFKKTIEQLLEQNEQFSKRDNEKETELKKSREMYEKMLDENSQLKNQVNHLEDQLNLMKHETEDTKEKLKHIESERQIERVAHQRLLAEKNSLEERLEIMNEDKGTNMHKRSSSDASTISVQDEDNGYGSVKSSSISRASTPTPDQQVNISLVVSNLQKKNKTLVNEISRQQILLTEYERKLSTPEVRGNKDETLEIENSRLRADLNALREAVANDTNNKSVTVKGMSVKELALSLERTENELRRVLEENTILRKNLGARVSSTSSLAKSSYADIGDPSIINEDGELVLAFEALKRTLRQVESELQEKREEHVHLIKELNNYQTENERLREILMSSSKDNSALSQAHLQVEITRISSDYVELQEKYDQLSMKFRKSQDQLNKANKKLIEAGLMEDIAEKINTSAVVELMPFKEKEKKIKGMFEFQQEHIPVILKQLLSLKPKDSLKLLPGLPAYILFMCIRYTDYIKNEQMLQSFILGYAKHIKNVVKKQIDCHIDNGSLWLANTLQLVNTLKQYSGDPHFSSKNTPTQNEQCLVSYDLSECRQMLTDQAIAICQGLLKKMCNSVQPYAVAAILEHEAISGLTSSVPNRTRSSSVSQVQSTNGFSVIDQLLELLTSFLRSLHQHGVDPHLPAQFFIKIFYNLCAHSLNNLLLRKEYCHWSKGMQIRYNLSHLEQWVREQINDSRVIDTLAPIIQASQLLQARKTDADVQNVAEMCSNLNTSQILKLLNMYTPIDSYEEKVSEQFIVNITNYLQETRDDANQPLMLDVNETFAIEFPFTSSHIRLEDIDVPEIFNLPMLKKI